jgi:hypothetical protein
MLIHRRYRDEDSMDNVTAELEPVNRIKRFVKAELKRADVTYEELARRLRDMEYEETKSA